MKLKIEKVTNRNNENGYSFALILVNPELKTKKLIYLFDNEVNAKNAKRAMMKLAGML